MPEADRSLADITSYLEMVRLKTAALLRAACRVGAVLSEAGELQADALGQSGEALGIAFQIRDDLLPYGPQPTRQDKPADSDLRNERPALPLLLAARASGPGVWDRLVGDGRPDADGLRTLLGATGALEEARCMLDGYVRRAHTALEKIPASGHRQTLARVADFVQVSPAWLPARRTAPAAAR
ncbi:polyprenyl synthetase family protein [Streptomyces sp. NPDC048496]|uniref:polyprenyl synthetase family protein n=1 Tax=Streptomyces sp. NPDC048496 TaxID=3365558 RepID=UPI00371FB833